ncbi:MAG: transcriptional regulator [Planctomycetota bacterium]|nr:transcriptional regulator [Planctomycetota bacterium]
MDVLSMGRARSAGALAAACGVSRRTIFRDLATLRDAGLPIRFDEERGGFLLDRQPYLQAADFTLSEALSLLALCDSADDRPAGVPFQRTARGAALKLLSILPPKLRDQLGNLGARVDVEIGPVNPEAVAEKHHDAILTAIHERHKLRIIYNSLYEDQTITTLLSPYCLHFHRRSWYVIGRSSLHRSVRTFNTARILDAQVVDSHFEIPPRFSLDRHFGQAWSMIPERNARHEVLIRFQKKVARNVREVMWHRTQRTTWHEKTATLDFEVTVDGLNEVMWWVLGYGKEAEVLQPIELRQKVSEHAEAMASLYRRKPKKMKASSAKQTILGNE